MPLRHQKDSMGKRSGNRDDYSRQIAAMKSRFPGFEHHVKSGKLCFIGDLVILPELPVYNVTITYNGGRIPTVVVNSPALVEKPPHTYPDKSLCLFHRKNYNWDKNFLIAKNIVDWTAAWAFFYEYWLQTGTWVGPEVPHELYTDKYND